MAQVSFLRQSVVRVPPTACADTSTVIFKPVSDAVVLTSFVTVLSTLPEPGPKLALKPAVIAVEASDEELELVSS